MGGVVTGGVATWGGVRGSCGIGGVSLECGTGGSFGFLGNSGGTLPGRVAMPTYFVVVAMGCVVVATCSCFLCS